MVKKLDQRCHLGLLGFCWLFLFFTLDFSYFFILEQIHSSSFSSQHQGHRMVVLYLSRKHHLRYYLSF